jgi:hypothetical protein
MQNLWLFQFAHPLGEDQTQALAQQLHAALSEWKAHGTPVQSRVVFRYAHFLFIEAVIDVSGCSIDWLHNTVLGITNKLDLQLADSSRIFFWTAEETIDSIDFRELEAALVTGKLTPETRVFDSQALHTGAFDKWEAPLADTWMRRYTPNIAVKS